MMKMHKLLLADDHAVVREGIRTVLHRLESVEIVGEVENGSQLMEALALLQPDLLLLDVTMPNFDPITAVHVIRHRFADLKILVVSAHDDDLYVQGFLRAGVQGYHLKDDPLRNLSTAVEQILSGHRWISKRLQEKSSRPFAQELPQLSGRQIELLQLLKEGLDNRAIATALDVSIKTVENHLTRLYRQLNVQSRLEAVHYVQKHPQLLLSPFVGSRVASAESLFDADRSHTHPAILVVDDNERYRSKLCGLINKYFPQLQLLQAGNIDSAVAYADTPTLCLALVDVILGDEDGIRCVRRLKAARPHLRIVLMSAYPDREFHRLGLQAGAIAFVDKKDLNGESVRNIVEDALA